MSIAVGSIMVTKAEPAESITSESSFDEVFVHYHKAIYSYVLRFMGRPEDAEDLTLTSFEKAFKAWPKRPPDLQVRPWLYRIATNTCLDELRHRKLIRWLPFGNDGVGVPHPVADDDPEDTVIKREDARAVRKALDKLPERYRAALVLRESEGFSCEQIGEALGISRSAAKVLLFRAREKLRVAYFALSAVEETR